MENSKRTYRHHAEGHEIEVNGVAVLFKEPRVSGKEILEKSGHLPVECFSLYQKFAGGDFERVAIDDEIDISDERIEHFVTKEPDFFNYTVNGQPESTDRKHLTADEILRLAGIDVRENYLVQIKQDGIRIPFALNGHEEIKMVCTGLVFESAPWIPLVDIEEYGRNCKEVPFARKYKIKIDKNYHIVDSPFITGKQLIELEKPNQAGKFNVLKFTSDNPRPVLIGHEETVSLFEKCLLRFVIQPKEQKDGRGSRRDFALPQEDLDYLNKLALPWDAINSGGMWVVIQDYPIPDGYNVRNAEIAVMVPPNYPVAQIDMVYFFPHLQKQSGRAITAITAQMIDGKNFQRWSRHRQPNEWVPGVDNLATHIALVDNWLLIDLKR